MAISHHNLFLTTLLVLHKIIAVYSRGSVYKPPEVERLTDRFSRLSVNQSYDVFFGGSNVHLTSNGTSADLNLDKSSGSGLESKNKYYYGFFNAAIKLPSGFTSGVVVAYYLSNADVFPHNHDEIDIELLWFDPTQSFHDYSILWNSHHIVFLVDNIPSCPSSSLSSLDPVDGEQLAKLSSQQITGLEWARRKHMFYSYCQDKPRYKVRPAECNATQ